jgi:hypothetical protein
MMPTPTVASHHQTTYDDMVPYGVITITKIDAKEPEQTEQQKERKI